MRYRRHGIFDTENNTWKTYYINSQGKIIFDRGKKSYQEVRKEIKKNTNYDFKSDITNRKASKVIFKGVKQREKWQNETDRLLKKRSLTNKDKDRLKNLKEITQYKKPEIQKKLKTRKRKKEDIDYRLYQILCTFGVTTSSYFFIAEESFDQIKSTVKTLFNYTDRVMIDFQGMSIFMFSTDFDSISNFESSMAELLTGYGKIEHQRGKYSLLVRALKR